LKRTSEESSSTFGVGCTRLLLAAAAFEPLMRIWLGAETEEEVLMQRVSLETGAVNLDDIVVLCLWVVVICWVGSL